MPLIVFPTSHHIYFQTATDLYPLTSLNFLPIFPLRKTVDIILRRIDTDKQI